MVMTMLVARGKIMPKVPFGERVRRRRDELGMSQGALAERMGMTQGNLSRWEGRNLPPKDDEALELLAGHLRWSLDELLGIGPEPEDVNLPEDELIRRLVWLYDGPNSSPKLFAQLVESYHQVILEEREDIAAFAKWKASRKRRNESKDEAERG